jgi:hypothetical protein
MSAKEQTKRIAMEEEALAPLLVLLIGKLTGWNAPVGSGGDPSYLTSEQSAELATEGISALSRFLPQETALQVTAAIERLPRAKHGSREERLLQMAEIGSVILAPGSDPNGPPGCCIPMNGHLICVR